MILRREFSAWPRPGLTHHSVTVVHVIYCSLTVSLLNVLKWRVLGSGGNVGVCIIGRRPCGDVISNITPLIWSANAPDLDLIIARQLHVYRCVLPTCTWDADRCRAAMPPIISSQIKAPTAREGAKYPRVQCLISCLHYQQNSSSFIMFIVNNCINTIVNIVNLSLF